MWLEGLGAREGGRGGGGGECCGWIREVLLHQFTYEGGEVRVEGSMGEAVEWFSGSGMERGRVWGWEGEEKRRE